MTVRPSGRAPNQLRAITLEPGFAKYAEGSCMTRFGDPHVLCTASVEERVPPFLRNTGTGWVTAEYGMLPRATHERNDREAARGRQGGRTQEIQRLIGRSLRTVVDLAKLGERQIRIDCDVIQADGGTRTAAVTGSWVALHLRWRSSPHRACCTATRYAIRSPPFRAGSIKACRSWTWNTPRIPRPRRTPISC